MDETVSARSECSRAGHHQPNVVQRFVVANLRRAGGRDVDIGGKILRRQSAPAGIGFADMHRMPSSRLRLSASRWIAALLSRAPDCSANISWPWVTSAIGTSGKRAFNCCEACLTQGSATSSARGSRSTISNTTPGGAELRASSSSRLAVAAWTVAVILGMNASRSSQRQNGVFMVINTKIRSVASGNHGKSWFRDACVPCGLFADCVGRNLHWRRSLPLPHHQEG
jgi:hypothetical protein